MNAFYYLDGQNDAFIAPAPFTEDFSPLTEISSFLERFKRAVALRAESNTGKNTLRMEQLQFN